MSLSSRIGKKVNWDIPKLKRTNHQARCEVSLWLTVLDLKHLHPDHFLEGANNLLPKDRDEGETGVTVYSGQWAYLL